VLNGMPEPPITREDALRLRDYNVNVMLRAVDAAAPALAGDSARSAAHFAHVAAALSPLDPALARLARIVAAETLPVACDWQAKEQRETDPLDQGLMRLTRSEVEAAVTPMPDEAGIVVEETGFEVVS